MSGSNVNIYGVYPHTQTSGAGDSDHRGNVAGRSSMNLYHSDVNHLGSTPKSFCLETVLSHPQQSLKRAEESTEIGLIRTNSARQVRVRGDWQ